MKPITPKTKQEARQYAIDWQKWQSTQSMSFGEIFDWQYLFQRIGRKFDLTDEFRENGII